MDRESIVEKVRQYGELVREHFPVLMVVLFGSFAKGTQRRDSDVDVAVVVDKIEGDFLAWEAELYRLRRRIDSRIEPVLIEKSSDKSGFLEEVLQTGRVIYSQAA